MISKKTLAAIARLRIANVATPVATKLQRILSAQSYRFPELFHAAFEEGAGPTIGFLTDLFERFSKEGEINVTEPQRAATAFLSLAVGGPARIIVSGNKVDDTEIEKHIRFAVGLFSAWRSPPVADASSEPGCEARSVTVLREISRSPVAHTTAMTRLQPFAYSSWRRHQMPVSLRPLGARSSHWYAPNRPSSPRA